MSAKILLIGQAPGPNTDATRPLAPLPRTSAGGRLAQFAGLSPIEYLRRFDRTNLIHEFPGRWRRDDRWVREHARIAAAAMRPLLRGRTIIMVGRRVAEAFGYGPGELPFHVWAFAPRWEIQLAVVPHPSGRNHWYHKEANREAARAFWTELNYSGPAAVGAVRQAG